jgi:hypothetical protein
MNSRRAVGARVNVRFSRFSPENGQSAFGPTVPSRLGPAGSLLRPLQGVERTCGRYVPYSRFPPQAVVASFRILILGLQEEHYRRVSLDHLAVAHDENQ